MNDVRAAALKHGDRIVMTKAGREMFPHCIGRGVFLSHHSEYVVVRTDDGKEWPDDPAWWERDTRTDPPDAAGPDLGREAVAKELLDACNGSMNQEPWESRCSPIPWESLDDVGRERWRIIADRALALARRGRDAGLWECPECGFEMHKQHFREPKPGEDYHACPACGELAYAGEAGRLRERVRLLEAALTTIRQWDCLNPPATELLADLPWLRQVVDTALVSAPEVKTDA